MNEEIESDYVLKATKDSVVWGYFDRDAEPLVAMQIGKTITMEVITHHSHHDYAKMIRGDSAVDDIFYWEKDTPIDEKPVPKFAQSGVHIITGPVEIEGTVPGDVAQVEILELAPRKNPATGKTCGTNSAKFAGYQFHVEEADGTFLKRDGGD